MIATSDGLGDAGPLRRGGTDVPRGVDALVAIGDDADAEHAHRTCSSSVEGDLRNDVGGHTRRCTIIIFIAAIIVTGTAGARAVHARAAARRASGDGA